MSRNFPYFSIMGLRCLYQSEALKNIMDLQGFSDITVGSVK